MNSLVEYGSSSSSSSSSSDTDEDCEMKTNPNINNKAKLPKPKLGNESSLNNSVFTNPFVKAELAKAAILEKHVKMVPGKNQVQTINGKKICWNFRKGRCRFGHNCKYAHDTDIQKTADELEVEKQKLKTVICEGSGTITAAPPPSVIIEEGTPKAEDVWEGVTDKRKLKRPGLSQNLVPGKKVLKLYREQKFKDTIT